MNQNNVKQRRIAVYGSLRLEEYNYNYFKTRYGNGINYIKTMVINGYKLYSLGSYPGIKETSDNTELTVDILEVSEDVYDMITDMELCSGYKIKKLNIDEQDTVLYVYTSSTKECKLVESGDWSNYLNAKQLTS